MLQAKHYPKEDLLVSPRVTVILYKETSPPMREFSIHTQKETLIFLWNLFPFCFPVPSSE